MYIEYRVKPETEPHKWQREKEAYLAAFPVEFRNTTFEGEPGQYWHRVDSWLVDWCTTQKGGKTPLWDREDLEFRIVPKRKVS